ncbi:PH domain-containing protein [Virgibacillus siamensis]|uniref:PH domain-containing protein n=1 Tax=Virgibacillus siamensis TaxID=480071 RepID=UPI0011159469|nr:PH domain-containing protein [Virgibacillus siamensis]
MEKKITKEVTEIFFTSKKDATYSLIFWGTVVFVFFSILLSFSLTVPGIIIGIIGLMAIGFMLWIWFGTGYRIENHVIKIKNGPFRSEIAIQDINSIGKTKSLMATPALSVERLTLRYGKYSEMLLSPKNEKEFVELLLAKNPQIKLIEKTS